MTSPSTGAFQHFTRSVPIASEGRPLDALPELDAGIAIDSAVYEALTR